MKYFLLALILCLTTLTITAQAPYDKDVEQALGYFQQGDCTSARTSFNKVFDEWAAHEQSLLYSGICYLSEGNFSSARDHLEKAFLVDNGTPDGPAYLAVLEILEKNNFEKAKKYVSQSAALSNTNEINNTIGILRDYGTAYSKEAIFEKLIIHLEAEFLRFGSGIKLEKAVAVFTEGAGFLEAGNVSSAKSKFEDVIKIMLTLSPQLDENLIQTIFYMGLYMKYYQHFVEAKYFTQKGLDFYKQKQTKNNYQLAKLVNQMSGIYSTTGEHQKCVVLCDKYIESVKQQPFSLPVADLIYNKTVAYIDLKTNDFGTEANKPIKEGIDQLAVLDLEPGRKRFFSVIINNMLAVYYLKINEPRTAKEKGEKALADAKEYGYTSQIGGIEGNLNIIYYRLGEANKLIEENKKRVDDYLASGKYKSAALELNNQASILQIDGNCIDAIPLLERSVKIIEDFRDKVPKESRLAFLNEQVSSYQYLVSCLAKENEKEKLFQAMENSRGRVMAESLGLSNSLNTISLLEAQQLAKGDEAIVVYAASGPGKVTICVITNSWTNIVQVNLEEELKKVTLTYKKFLDASRGTSFNPFRNATTTIQADVTYLLREVMQDAKGTTELASHRDMLLSLYYRFLIEPIIPYVQNKKNLVVCPNQYLSFIPFEALRSSSGKYVIEDFGIRYVPSIKIMKLLKERNYSTDRKNVLAFGGANYEPYTLDASPIKTELEYFNLQEAVNYSFSTKSSQRQHYANLGVMGKSWAYLIGTLKEVAAIKEKVTGVDAYFADDFTENNIKEMSISGAMSNYKAVHFATHGMAVSTIPQLSTIITSLYMEEKGGEDGYLTAQEVNDLKLKADFVALSACETGLGKVYAGEGVSGFMQSFIQAGANGISVSQWAISDYATMIFMSGLYDLVFNEKMTFYDAMVMMKRKFVRGEYGQDNMHPNFWAPFAYYGK